MPSNWPAQESALLRAGLESLPLGRCMVDPDGRLLLADHRFQTLWDLPESLLRPGTPYATIVATMRSLGIETEAHPIPLSVTSEGALTRRREWQRDNGSQIAVTMTTLADGSSIALHEDITAHRRTLAQMARLATQDSLTGLPNRSTLRDELLRLLARNKRGEHLAVLCLDLDRFKEINDLLGHPAGDTLLTQVAERLLKSTRETDVVLRLGGDEFAVLQCGPEQPASSATLARRIIASISLPFDIDGLRAQVGMSVGIAIAPMDGDEPELLLKNADLALYRAKSEGRGILRYFEPGMDGHIQSRRALEKDLRLALEANQFHLAYQPQVDTRSGTVSGFEALLRWQHPARGTLAPAEFIAMAEQNGLFVLIGTWALGQACRDAATWPSTVRLAVNVSAEQFAAGSLVREVMGALGDAELEPNRLELEITESVLMRDASQVLQMLRELQRHGVRIAIDDFGTGYSSLNYLRNFPFDRIKIDRSFIDDIESTAEVQSIVRAIAGLGRSLDMAVTMEGVETLGQLLAVRREGCQEAQGNWFGRPHPACDVPHMIATSTHQMQRVAEQAQWAQPAERPA